LNLARIRLALLLQTLAWCTPVLAIPHMPVRITIDWSSTSSPTAIPQGLEEERIANVLRVLAVRGNAASEEADLELHAYHSLERKAALARLAELGANGVAILP